MRLLAIDPGAQTGFAVFERVGPGAPWNLIQANVLPPGLNLPMVVAPDIVVIEMPKVYPNGRARPNDLMTLACIVGRYQERYRNAKQHLVYPRNWKGSIDGDIMSARIKAALTPHEQGLAATFKFDHNMLDAIGMGKWALRQPWIRVLEGSWV
jgi:hypothetical protein